MDLLFWGVVFAASIVLLVKGADWFLQKAEKIGIALGFSPFLIGVVLVGLGTSFPETASSLAAVWQGATEIVAANAVGSNIANILLVVGIAAVLGRKMVVTKNLIDLDLPLLAISTTVFLGIALDGVITILESLLLIALFIIYLFYTATHTEEVQPEEGSVVVEPHEETAEESRAELKRALSIHFSDFLVLIGGVFALIVGSKYLIDSVIAIAGIVGVGVGTISLVAIAIGTSLPELLVSAKAALQNKAEVALGNIFGSNVFNILFVVGLPGLFSTLIVDEQTLALGIPVMIAATILFVISGISKQIYRYEGAMFLVLYIFFVGKLAGII